MFKRSTFSLLKPVSARLKLFSARRKRKAPTVSTSESATCEITSALASGVRAPNVEVPRPI